MEFGLYIPLIIGEKGGQIFKQPPKYSRSMLVHSVRGKITLQPTQEKSVLLERYHDLASQKVHRRSQVSRKEHSRQRITSGTYPIKRAVYLVQAVLLLLGCLST